LIKPDQTIPAPWDNSQTMTVSAEAKPEVVERLHQAWRERERLVIIWDGPLPPEAPVLDIAFHELSPQTEVPGERLRFAATANSVNLLGDEPDFAPLQRAAELGAIIIDGEATDRGPGEVTLANGNPAWVDGGPLARLTPADLEEVAVVPAAHLIAGRLAPETLDWPDPSAELAPDQLLAVGHAGGPARIIAPAGSGKTRVLTERTRHLVNDRGIRPAVVSLVAYNRRARAEMAERLSDIGGLDIRTLNSLALAITTGRGPFVSSGRRDRLMTINEMDARRLLERIVPGKRRRQLTDPLEPWIDALSACRLGLRDPHEVESAYGADVAGFADVVGQYRAALADRSQLDYDEQILRAVEVLLTEPEARLAARQAAPVLLVDEFQDLTPAHLLLIRLLSGPAAEVFAVGDDDQTIYGYSGASPDWLVNFDTFFPGAADHRLTINYRCPPSVVTAATNLLSHNRTRVAKVIAPAPGRTEIPVAGGDRGLAVNTAADPQRALIERVEKLTAEGTSLGDIAVLARVHAALLPAAVYLSDAGFPVTRSPGVGPHLLERSGIAAALAWLRLAAAPAQRLSGDDLRLAIRRPPRSFHPRIVDWICEQTSIKTLTALANRLTSERDATNLTELVADIASLRQQYDAGTSTVDLLDVIYNEIGLLGAASQLDQSQRTARRAAHADELAALRAIAEIGPVPLELEGWIRDHLDTMPSDNDAEANGTDPVERVTLATIHTTKGLEWDHVVVHDVRGDLHPHRLANDQEEERRIFHVAVTRGRRSVLVNAVPRGAPHPRSPFVAELAEPRPDDLPWPTAKLGVGASQTRQKLVQSTGKDARGAGPRPRTEPASETEAARRQALTEWRSQRCKADGVPAYVVLDNATLDAIAASNPTSLSTLGQTKGIGPTKLDRYGADILGVVASIDS